MTDQITTPPLYTNTHKKIVFIFSVFSSCFFNVLLFSSIGDSAVIRIIWGLVGIAAVFFQTVKLREFFNVKKNSRYIHLTFYIVCTIGSIAGTLGAGYSHIEKTKLKDINKIAKLEIIEFKINDIENKKVDHTDKAINSVMLGTNLNQWAVIRLIKEKEKLKKNKIIKYETLTELKTARAEILKVRSGIINSLSGLSRLFKMPEEKIAFIFLIFIAIILEMMVFGSATFTGKLFKINKTIEKPKIKINKIEKQKKTGQRFFFKVAA